MSGLRKKARNDNGKEEDIDNTGTLTLIPRPSDEDIDWNTGDWIRATATKNYILNDGFLDLLEMKSSVVTRANPKYQRALVKMIGQTQNKNSTNFITSIMNQGTRFEHEVYKLIVERMGPTKVVDIGGCYNPRSKLKYDETMQAMKDGIPVIYQGVVRNYEHRIHGIPDLLIRSDYINELVDHKVLKKDERRIRAPKVCRKHKRSPRRSYHYVVVDIKYKTLDLRSDGIHLLNSGIMKAYKSQLWVYNESIAEMQGYRPAAAYILGRKWKYEVAGVKHSNSSCFSKLGKIDYTGLDSDYVDLSLQALQWIRDVATEGQNWELKVPLPREELYPNQCNRYDFPYHKLKATFAEDIKDITMLWKCGPKQRKIAHENGIYSWDDPRCNAENLGVKGNYTSKILNVILEANHRQDPCILPRYIKNNYGDWKVPGKLDFYVDFEMTCSVLTEFDTLPYSEQESIIFMIGVGHMDPASGSWIFKNFITDTLSSADERTICSNFSNYIKMMSQKYGCYEPKLYHWSHAEPIAWRKAATRHFPSSSRWATMHWLDLLKVFQTEPIGIKGCLNYSLKTVAKTFHRNKYIKSIWDNGSSCADGADAAVGAYKVHNQCMQNGTSFPQDPLIQEIARYNEIDCKVLQEITYYLRENHVGGIDDSEEEDGEEITNRNYEIYDDDGDEYSLYSENSYDEEGNLIEYSDSFI